MILAVVRQIGERIVEGDQDDRLGLQVLRDVIGQAGPLGVVDLLRVRIGPVILPPVYDRTARRFRNRRRQLRPWASIMASISAAVISWPGFIGASPPRKLLASSSPLVTIGGALTMPSLAGGHPAPA